MSLREKLVAEYHEERARWRAAQEEQARLDAANARAILRPLVEEAMAKMFPGEPYTIEEPEEPTDHCLPVTVGDLRLMAYRKARQYDGPTAIFRVAIHLCKVCGKTLWSHGICYTRRDIAEFLEWGAVAEHECEGVIDAYEPEPEPEPLSREEQVLARDLLRIIRQVVESSSF